MSHRTFCTLIFLWFVVWLAGCAPSGVLQQSTNETPVTGTVTALDPPTPTQSSSAWQQIDQAMELRTLRLTSGELSGFVTVIRFDPVAYKISVKYDIENAGYVGEWFQALKPIAVINGGYFDENYKPTALVIFDGIRRGDSYEGFGGMVVINEQGEFELRSLRQQPFDPNEALQQAMQSAPMLIQPGGTVSDFEIDQDRSRRSVIARDRQGRILLIASNAAVFTLRELAQALQASDLDLDAALNLDGGRSTGLYLRTDAASVTIDSMEKLPLVLVVERSS